VVIIESFNSGINLFSVNFNSIPIRIISCSYYFPFCFLVQDNLVFLSICFCTCCIECLGNSIVGLPY
jgi:hypothetical protein